jgi:hypothetical protein
MPEFSNKILFFDKIFFHPMLSFGSATYLGPFGDPVAFRACQEQHKFDFENKQKDSRKKNSSMPKVFAFCNIYEVFLKLTHSFNSFSV